MLHPSRSFRFQLALKSLEEWLSAADTEQERLNAEEQWTTDATFFLYSLRNVLRSAELAARSAPRTSADHILRLIDTFNESVPSLRNLRNVLEHFDAYLEMKGDLQHPAGTRARKRKPDSAIDPWEGKRKRHAPPGSFGFWAARLADDDLLVGAGELELRVDVAIRAARDMVTAILTLRSDE
jgi:hypothetical protein